MSRSDRSRGQRRLDTQERALWSSLIRTVKPLRSRVEPEPPVADVPEDAHKPSPRSNAVPSRRARSGPKPSAPAAPLDSRLKQRLARGTEHVEARLDLHGRTQAEAHAALLRFLRRAQGQGVRIVLVITGKGARSDESSRAQGVLRRQVPIWLQLPEFRPYVVGFGEAHVSHGGEGALYVRVRRRRAD
jgi:DNA-nicking Smr family endonuclease